MPVAIVHMYLPLFAFKHVSIDDPYFILFINFCCGAVYARKKAHNVFLYVFSHKLLAEKLLQFENYFIFRILHSRNEWITA